MSLTTQDLKKIQGMMDVALKAQDERFSARLMKHFYTKDEIDRKLAKVNNELKRMNNDLEKVHNSQLRMEHTLTEHIKAIYDREDDHSKKIKNHEKRITRLEETGV